MSDTPTPTPGIVRAELPEPVEPTPAQGVQEQRDANQDARIGALDHVQTEEEIVIAGLRRDVDDLMRRVEALETKR